MNGKAGREEAKKDPPLAISKFAKATQGYLSALSRRHPRVVANVGHRSSPVSASSGSRLTFNIYCRHTHL